MQIFLNKIKWRWSRTSTKSLAGQSQLLVSLFVALFAVGAVVATNSTIGGNITGFFVGDNSTDSLTNITIENISETPWMNSTLNLYLNETYAQATLSYENGSYLPEQYVGFYLDSAFLESKYTDSQGNAEINLNLSAGVHEVKAAFEGNSSLFVNPSETLKEVGFNLSEPVETETVVSNDSANITNETSANASEDDNILNITAVDIASNVIDLDEATTRSIVELKIQKKAYSIGDKIKLDVLLDDATIKKLKDRKIKGLDRNDFKVILISPEGIEKEISFKDLKNGKEAEFDTGRSFRPGTYKLKTILFEGNANETVVETNFTLGLVNINTKKSIYLPNEKAVVVVGVLDSTGSRVYNANANVTITSPSGTNTSFSYDSLLKTGDIENNNDGTYSLNYNTNETGIYKIYAHATTDYGVDSEYQTSFEVRNSVDFDIERIAPTIVPLEGGNVRISITPKIDAVKVSVVEYVPKDWNLTTNGNISVNGNDQIITWLIGDASKDKNFYVDYSFDPPDVSPMLSLAGPAEINYDNGKSFKEAREWTIGIDPVFYYYVKWDWRWDSQGNISDPLTLCKGQDYNVSVLLMELADDSDTNALTSLLQLQPDGESTYTNLPYANWTYWNGQSNSITIADLDIGAANVCNPATDESHCFMQFRYLNITNDVSAKNYKLKFTATQVPGLFQEGTNIIDTRVIDCKYANIKREIKIYSPSGEDGSVIKGHVAFIAVPLANYNTTQAVSGNVSVSLLDGTTPLSWYFWDNICCKRFDKFFQRCSCNIGGISTIDHIWRD